MIENIKIFNSIQYYNLSKIHKVFFFPYVNNINQWMEKKLPMIIIQN